MTTLPIDRDGLAAATAALRRDDAVVIPFPTPLPYVVAGLHPAVVNAAKGRPLDQPCGMLAGHAAHVMSFVDLDEETARFATWISEVDKANLLLPVAPNAPRWFRSAAVDGRVGVTLACLPQLRPLLEPFGHVFVSSGNRTGEPVATTAHEAHHTFGQRLLVLDGDALRDPGTPHGSATMIDVRRSGELRVVRDGINNRQPEGADHTAYLNSLRHRFTHEQRAARARSGPAAKPPNPS